ncbi:deoxyguanosinetriphosphate triphosphohydrolase [Micrococcales bacterium 31B]|nr:deoxyguanosinetriphosphate triphosphohydrolase [Micrococcales bacterium 31B]
MADGYAPRDEERFLAEAPKSVHRSPFERDRARLLHSSALRRLGAKTQVMRAGSDDFVRTRLTHSLEVAQVGRGLAAELGCDPDVVDTACLAHDLGHPPFGHNGERTLNLLAQDIGGFEGNAQTLRIVARLEPKVLRPDGTSAGLNLTRASLDAICKYPYRLGRGPQGGSSDKHGVYASEADVFEWVRSPAPRPDGTVERLRPPWRRCFEADVMDISDDIAYSVHDVEDAVVLGHIDLRGLADAGERRAALTTAREWYRRGTPLDDLDAALARLEDLPFWVAGYDGSIANLAALKDLTSQLIGRFCGAVVAATRERFGPAPLSRYAAALVVPEATMNEICVLKGIAAHYVMAAERRQPMYKDQAATLETVVDLFRRTGEKYLEPPHREHWQLASSDPERDRIIIDQVASLTDGSVMRWRHVRR